MAHFAFLNNLNIVTTVVVVPNEACLNNNAIEEEYLGVEYCVSLWGEGTWLQTSYNGNIRKNYAGIGYFYDKDRDAFIPPKPFESWVLDEDTCWWNPPSPRPQDGKAYNWDEDSLSWVEIDGGLP